MSNGWYKIVWTQCAEGYAYTSNTTGKYYTYVEKTPTVEPAPAPAEPETPAVQEPATTSKTVVAKQSAKFKDTSLKGKYVVDASSVNVRDGAGTEHKVLTTIPRNTVVTNYGYYNTVDNEKWLYVKFDYKNVTYTAFITSRYLKKV